MSNEPVHTQNKVVATPVLNAGSVGAAAPVRNRAAPLAALLSGHLLQDGEVILLILKPSVLFVVLSTLRWAAAAIIFMLAGLVFDDQLPGHARTYVEIGIFALAGRLVWALLQWMGRLYILTDMRIVRVGGVFNLFIYDCPLRKMARTRILYTVRERIFGVGSIEIIPSDEEYAIGMWQMISKPILVNEQIVAAVNKAKGRC